MKKLLFIGVTFILSGMTVISSTSEAQPPLRAYSCHHVVNGVMSPRIYAWAATADSCPAPPHNSPPPPTPPIGGAGEGNPGTGHPLDHDYDTGHDCDTVAINGEI